MDEQERLDEIIKHAGALEDEYEDSLVKRRFVREIQMQARQLRQA